MKLPDRCAACNKRLSKLQAETSYHSTHEIGGNNGIVLCRKHLDQFNREQ